MKILYTILILLCLASCNRLKKSDHKETSATSHKMIKTQNNSPCNFETYLIYDDSVPIFLEPKGKIIKYFRFEDNPEYDFGGTLLFKNATKDWLQIGKNQLNPELENYWIQSKYIQIGTTNYNHQKIPLFEQPNKNAKTTGFLKEESYLNVLACHHKWAYVKKDELEGWLPPEFICNNSVTNCN